MDKPKQVSDAREGMPPEDFHEREIWRWYVQNYKTIQFALAHLEARLKEGWNTNMEEAPQGVWILGKCKWGGVVQMCWLSKTADTGCWVHDTNRNTQEVPTPTAWREITPPSDEMLEKWMGE